MPSKLKVSPLKNYSTPKYPSHKEKNPLYHDYKREQGNLAYYSMALCGVIGLFSFSSAKKGEKPEMPIKFSDLGFPHTYASYGTGLPSRLEREKAVAIIDAVFKANGIKLKKEVPVSKEGVKLTATGFNQEKNVGYVWLDYKTVAHDGFNKWWMANGVQLLDDDKKKLDKQLKEEKDEWDARRKFWDKVKHRPYYRLLEIKEDLTRQKHPLAKKVEKYLKTNTEDLGNSAYGKELLKEYDQMTINIPEMKKVLGDKGAEQKIGLFSTYDNRFSESHYWPKNQKPKKSAVEQLEEVVQDYIDWAKAEGRF